jgi:hypothetical protein
MNLCGRSFKPVHAGQWLLAVIGTVFLALMTETPSAQQSSSDVSMRIAFLQAGLAGLDPEIAYLKDRQDIFDAAKRYTRGADRHDNDLVRSAFWPDATISYATPMRLEEYVEWEESTLAGYANHQHHITGQTVEFDGDTAHVESYVIYFLVPRDRSADFVGPATPGRALTSEKTYLGSGRYLERWEKRDGQWKIVVREYVEDLALKGETVDLCSSRTCLGSWDRDDLSYARPLQSQSPEQRRVRGEANSQPRHPQGSRSSSVNSGN